MKKISRLIKLFIIISFLVASFLFVTATTNSSIHVFGDSYDSDYIYALNRLDKSKVVQKYHKSKAYPASLTKIMTTIVALEHIDDLSAIAPVDLGTYREMVNNNASMAGFYGNEKTTYSDLLYGTILSSGGEAANYLAINDDVKYINIVMGSELNDISNLSNEHIIDTIGIYELIK